MSEGERFEAWSGLMLALSSLLVVTCAGSAVGQGPASSARAPAPTSSSSPTVAVVESGAAGAVGQSTQGATTEPASGASSPAHHGTLATFWNALDALKSGMRHEPVRAVWFGDSHTAADFWVQPVRKLLSEQFGSGGPGYLYAGLGVYRHGAANVEVEGHWRTLPRAPSGFVKQQGDGVYGLGGMRTVPRDERARVTLRARRGALHGRARWQVIYRLPEAGSRFALQLDPGQRVEVKAGVGTVQASGLSMLELESEPEASLTLFGAVGEPEIFGVVLEGSEPGVVLDTLGINGARVATPLTWDAAQFSAEVKRRNPDLIILAYGTNEIGDQVAPSRYAAHFDALLARLRDGAPQAACLILGPTDRALPDWHSNPRGAEIEAVERQVAEQQGCAFFSMIDAMGGQGALQRWAFSSPALARKDRVHLTIDGYEMLGRTLGEDLLARWRDGS